MTRRSIQMRRRVFVVDDHAVVRRGLRELLTEATHFEWCGEAANGLEALEQIAELRPELAVVDLSLEGLEGLELVHQIVERVPETRVVVFSMHDEELFAPRALAAGAFGYVSKSEKESELLEALRAAAAGRVHLSASETDRLVQQYRREGVDFGHRDVSDLSDRELQVFELIGEGLTAAAIAERLHLSPKTVETHRQRIKQKLGIDSGQKLLIRASQWRVHG